MTEAPDGGPMGYDLDKTCSCQGEGSSCSLPPDQDGCDLPGGRDNALTPLLGYLAIALGEDLGTYYSAMSEGGHWSLLLRVRGYNGEPDDDRVDVSLFGASGLSGLPGWDGGDVWPVTEASLQPGGDLEEPLYHDPFAYVTGGLLVTGLAEVEIVFGGSPSYLAIKMTGGFITGRIEPHEGSYALRDAVISGRIAVADLFAAVSSFRDNGGGPMCTDNIFFSAAKKALCDARDMTVLTRAPTVPCNAVSWAVAFEAEPAQLGPIEPGATPDGGCPPDADPANDSCDDAG